MKAIRLLAFFLVATALPLHAPPQQNAAGTLEVQVRDHYTHEPLETVILTLWKGDLLIDSVRTDASGHAVLETSATGIKMPVIGSRALVAGPVYPNPFVSETRVGLALNEPQTIRVSIINVVGQQLLTREFQMEAGHQSLQVSMGGLPPGSYLLRFDGNQQQVLRLQKTGGQHGGSPSVTLDQGVVPSGPQPLSAKDEGYLLKAEKTPFDPLELTIDPDHQSAIELDMERNNQVDFFVQAEGGMQIPKALEIQGDDGQWSIVSPRQLILKSGVFSVVGQADSTTAINRSVELLSNDTTFVFQVSRVISDLGPLNLVVNIDESITSSKSIGKDGGELGLTDANGNEFILQVPEGALTGDYEIVMTAISDIEGFPFSGGMIGGVDLQPNGLPLYKPATLILRPADPGIISEMLHPEATYKLTGFGYRDEGKDFHMYPFFREDGEIQLRLTRFSGYGGGGATSGDQHKQRGHKPSDAESQAMQEAADILNKEMEQMEQNENHEIDPADQEKLMEIMRKWLNESVIPMSKEAETNGELLACALMEFFRWESYGQLLFPDEVFGDTFAGEIRQIEQSLKIGFANAAEEIHQKAVGNKDASQIYVLHNLAVTSQIIWGVEVFDFMGIYEKIYRFELDFESTIGQDEAWEISVKADRVVLDLDEQERHFVLSGEGPISHTAAWFDCIVSFQGQASTFLVDYARIALPPNSFYCDSGQGPPGNDGSDNGPDVYLLYVPGPDLRENFTIQCPDMDDPYTFGALPMWFGSYGHLHEAFFHPEAGFASFDWIVTMGEPYARKTYTHRFEDLYESTTFTLWYAPLP
jgi:hypothetical protein